MPDGLIFLVDASVYVRRAQHAAPPLDAVDRDGNPTHAVLGFARFLMDLIERLRPSRIAVAFDPPVPGSFRAGIYPPYKAQREPAPAGFALQLERCFEFCRLAGVEPLRRSGYEADDIIGSVASTMRAQGVRAALVTCDKDLAQVLRTGDVYWDYGAREPLGYHDIERRFGAIPERFADYLALTGDAADNIPGVPGIGPKTAAALMREFASLDDLYAGLERLADLGLRGTAALASRLLQHREAAYLARRLTHIACDVAVGLEDGGVRRRPQLDTLGSFFDQQRFGPMLRRQAQRLAELPL